MQDFQTIRFMQITSQSSGGEPLPRGVRRRYEIVRSDGSEGRIMPFLICDTEKSFLRGITRFHHDGANVAYLSAANRQGTAWELEGDDNKPLGDVIARDVQKSGWQTTTPQGRAFDIYEQANVDKNIVRSTLGIWPDAYACIEGTQEIGVIRREDRCEEQTRSGRPSFLGRLKKLMVTHDWVFSQLGNVSPEEELLLISGMLAIIEVTVPGSPLD